jgi:hypothetical protein
MSNFGAVASSNSSLLECQSFKLCIMDCEGWIWIRIRLVPLFDGDFLNPCLGGIGEFLGGSRKVSLRPNESKMVLTSVRFLARISSV